MHTLSTKRNTVFRISHIRIQCKNAALSFFFAFFHIQNTCARGGDFYRTFISPNNDASNG